MNNDGRLREDRLTWLKQISDVLLNTEEPQERLQAAVREFEEIMCEVHGVASAVVNESDRFRLSTPRGQVISAGYAVSTFQDATRSAKFLRALVAGIRTARGRFPGQRIHVVYAGPGPHAPFFVLAARQFAAAEVGFTMIEYLPASYEAACRSVATLGLEEYVIQIIQGDASDYQHTGQPFHVLIAEIMLRGLTAEGQVAIFKNLAPQMQADGVLIPARVDLRAVLTSPHLELSHRSAGPVPPAGLAARVDLGVVFSISLPYYQKLRRQYVTLAEYTALAELPATSVRIPENIGKADQFTIMTEIVLSDEIRLEEGESGLTMPLYEFELGQSKPGDELRIRFELGENPGLRYEVVRPKLRVTSR